MLFELANLALEVADLAAPLPLQRLSEAEKLANDGLVQSVELSLQLRQTLVDGLKPPQ